MSEYTCLTCGGTASKKNPCPCCGIHGYHGGGTIDSCLGETPRKIISHNWTTEVIVIGNIKQYFWICRNCGSSGGSAPIPGEEVEIVTPLREPFLAGTPLINISNNCQEAKVQIDEFVALHPVWKPYADKARLSKEIEWLKQAADKEDGQFPGVTGNPPKRAG